MFRFNYLVDIFQNNCSTVSMWVYCIQVYVYAKTKDIIFINNKWERGYVMDVPC